MNVIGIFAICAFIWNLQYPIRLVIFLWYADSKLRKLIDPNGWFIENL